MNEYFPFFDIRKPALEYWLKETKRERFGDSELFVGALECQWQFRFHPKAQESIPHVSVFCSMGNWNSNIGDLLDDRRFDGLTFHPDNAELLFRYYTRIFLIASEIFTDFQDILTVLRNGHVDAVKNRSENEKSRHELNPSGEFNIIQNLFDYINTICKHKTRNIHVCNHHLNYHFEDSAFSRPDTNFLSLQNVDQKLAKIRTSQSDILPTHIIVPKLCYVLQILIHGYQILDRSFRNNPDQFNSFCKIYEGESVRNQVLLPSPEQQSKSTIECPGPRNIV